MHRRQAGYRRARENRRHHRCRDRRRSAGRRDRFCRRHVSRQKECRAHTRSNRTRSATVPQEWQHARPCAPRSARRREERAHPSPWSMPSKPASRWTLTAGSTARSRAVCRLRALNRLARRCGTCSSPSVRSPRFQTSRKTPPSRPDRASSHRRRRNDGRRHRNGLCECRHPGLAEGCRSGRARSWHGGHSQELRVDDVEGQDHGQGNGQDVGLITPTTSYDGFADVDIVVEAVLREHGSQEVYVRRAWQGESVRRRFSRRTRRRSTSTNLPPQAGVPRTRRRASFLQSRPTS